MLKIIGEMYAQHYIVFKIINSIDTFFIRHSMKIKYKGKIYSIGDIMTYNYEYDYMNGTYIIMNMENYRNNTLLWSATLYNVVSGKVINHQFLREQYENQI